MTAEQTFLDHVNALSTHLRGAHDLTARRVSERSGSGVLLENESVQIEFQPGEARDSYVEVYVSFSDPSILAPAKSFELRRYVDYSDGWKFFPIRYPHGKATRLVDCDRNFLFVASPFLLQEWMSFLAAHGGPILQVDRPAIQSFMTWKHQADREYTDRVSGE